MAPARKRQNFPRDARERPSHRLTRRAADIVLAAAVICLAWAILHDPYSPRAQARQRLPFLGSYVSAMNEHPVQGIFLAYGDGVAPQLVSKFELADSLIPSAAPRGDVALRFGGFDRPEHRIGLFETYQRCVYTCYPRRVHVCEPNVLLNGNQDMPTLWSPEPNRLLSQGVKYVLTIQIDPAGQLRIDSLPLQADANR